MVAFSLQTTNFSWQSALTALIILWSVPPFSAGNAGLEDWLLPYPGRHGSKLLHRQVRDCQHIKYKNVTHELYAAHGTSNRTLILPSVSTKYFRKVVGPFYNQRTVYGHYNIIHNPRRTFSVLEPGAPGGCTNHSRETVKKSAQQKKCIVSTNAGFFNTSNGACLGNIFSEGKLVQSSKGIQNAHFGITKDGKIFVGYLSEVDLTRFQFANLVGGVIWLVRRGESYVDVSLKAECSDTEETGTLQRFANVVSARTSIGHDKHGRIILVTVDGKTDQAGFNLHEYANFLIEMGVYNAINLDGGGSATMVINRTTVNYPSDECHEAPFLCDRKVSTIVCAHEPTCLPSPDCDGHGNCVNGACVCHKYWSGAACDHLQCPANCSGHGNCTSAGCVCSPGWYGTSCNRTCHGDKYGINCNMSCSCDNKATCDPVDGRCTCSPGWAGERCDRLCPEGRYGARCRGICYCPNECFCDPFTGACNSSIGDETIHEAGTCLANKIIHERHLVRDKPVANYKLWVVSLVCISIIAAISIVINISLLCYYTNWTSRAPPKYQQIGASYSAGPQRITFIDTESQSSADESDGDIEAWDAARQTNGLVQIDTSDEEKSGHR